MATALGLEPRYAPSKGAVLPLNDTAMMVGMERIELPKPCARDRCRAKREHPSMVAGTGIDPVYRAYETRSLHQPHYPRQKRVSTERFPPRHSDTLINWSVLLESNQPHRVGSPRRNRYAKNAWSPTQELNPQPS